MRGIAAWQGLLIVVVLAAGVWLAWPAADDGGGTAPARRCGTPSPPPEVQDSIRAELEPFVLSRTAEDFDIELRIPVQFHVLHDGTTGNVPEKRLREQLQVLNDAFKPHGIEFTWHAAPTRSNKRSWFLVNLDKDGYSTRVERELKLALAVTPASVLNLYTAAPADYLGWATFPKYLSKEPTMDGVVVHHRSLPGGGYEGYDLGRTAVHEVGHWLGLWHIFHPWDDAGTSGCDGHGDEVADTPPQSQPGECFSQPGQRRNSCKHDRPDLEDHLRNYMDYVQDDAMDEFTLGQVRRMKEMTAKWRPALMAR